MVKNCERKSERMRVERESNEGERESKEGERVKGRKS